MSKSVEHGVRVTLHYRLSLAGGQEFESTFDGEPLTLQLGNDEFVPALEFLITGLMAGERGRYEIAASEGIFGEYDEEMVQEMELADFPDSLAIEEGTVYGFSTPAGDELPGVLREIRGDKAVVDFNHPLIGHDLVFEVQILAVEPGDI